MAADLFVKRERNQVSLYKKWSIVEAYLGSGQDARTYLEDYERRTGRKWRWRRPWRSLHRRGSRVGR